MAKKVTGKKNRASQVESKKQVVTPVFAKGAVAPPYSSDLKYSQPVRTSFRLSQEGSEALVWLAQSANVKFQGVLTHLAGALLTDKSLGNTTQSTESEQDSLLDRVVKAASDLDPKTRDTSARKTYVVTKMVLLIFNNIAKAYGLPRDLLVDLTLKLKRAESQAKADRSRKRYEDARQEIDHLWSEAESLEKRLLEVLDEDDPILNRFGMVIVLLMNLSMAIDANLKKNTPIDRDDISQQG